MTIQYIIPALMLLNLLATAVWAFISARQEARLSRLQDDLMDKINGKYLHSKVAEQMFLRLEEKIDALGERLEQRIRFMEES